MADLHNFESDYVSLETLARGHQIEPERRVAHSLEHIAYTLGQISKTLKRIDERLEADSQPKG